MYMKESSIIRPSRTITVIAGTDQTIEARSFDITLMRYPLDFEHTYFQVIMKKVSYPTLIPLEGGVIFRAKEISFQKDEIIFTLFSDDGESYAAALLADGIWTDNLTFVVEGVEKISPFTVEAPFGDFDFEPTFSGWGMTRKNVTKGGKNSPAYESKIAASYSAKMMLVKGTLEAISLRLVGNEAILYDKNEMQICALEINRII